MANFETRTSTEAGRVTVALAGECDLATRDQLCAALLDAVRQSRTVFVDVAELTFLDSSGVHGLVVAHHAARDAGGHVYVVNAVGHVAALLELTGLDALLRAPAQEHPHA